MSSLWDREPVLILTAAVVAVSVLLIAFIDMTDGELAAIIGLVTIAAGGLARSQVTPVAKLGAGE